MNGPCATSADADSTANTTTKFARVVRRRKMNMKTTKEKKEIQRLREWIRKTGIDLSICTYYVLNKKICDKCGCHRRKDK